MSHISFKCFHYGGCRDITQVRIETRRDRGGLEPKSKRGWRKREDRLRRTGDTQGHGPSTQRTRIDADTGKCKQWIYIYIWERMSDQDATTRDGAQVRYKRTGRRTDADACSLRRTKGSRSEVLPEALGRSSKQREPPRKPAQEKLWSKRGGRTEREASRISPTALRPLCPRSFLLPRPPPFIGQEGAVRH